jgi:hypothetical protein
MKLIMEHWRKYLAEATAADSIDAISGQRYVVPGPGKAHAGGVIGMVNKLGAGLYRDEDEPEDAEEDEEDAVEDETSRLYAPTTPVEPVEPDDPTDPEEPIE